MISNETNLVEKPTRGKNDSLVIALTQVNSHYVVFRWVENGWSDPGKVAGSSNGASAAAAGNWAEASGGATGDGAVPIKWRRTT